MGGGGYEETEVDARWRGEHTQREKQVEEGENVNFKEGSG